MDRDRLERVGRAIVHEARVEKIPFLAGSLAYHAFVSLLPLFALLLYVASGLGDQNLERGLILLSRSVFTEGAQDVLVQEMRDASRSTGLSILGLGVLVWGTLRIFRGLDTAFSDIYETEARNTFVDQLRDGVVVLVTFAVAVLIAVVIYRALPTGGAFAAFQPVALVIGLTITLLPMYYVFPDTDVSVREVLPGAVLAAAGLTVFHVIFQVYLQSGEQNVFGGILLLLTWLYAAGLVVLVGVVINAVLSNRSSDVSIKPVIGGVSQLSSADTWSKRELEYALSTLHERTSTRTSLTLVVDGHHVELPPPSKVEIGSDEGLFGNGDPTLTLHWDPTGPMFGGAPVDGDPAEPDESVEPQGSTLPDSDGDSSGS